MSSLKVIVRRTCEALIPQSLLRIVQPLPDSNFLRTSSNYNGQARLRPISTLCFALPVASMIYLPTMAASKPTTISDRTLDTLLGSLEPTPRNRSAANKAMHSLGLCEVKLNLLMQDYHNLSASPTTPKRLQVKRKTSNAQSKQ